MSVRPLQGGKTVMYNSSVQLGPTSFAKIKRTKFQVSRLRQSRSMYTGIVTGALNLVLWPYYQMTPNKLFIWPFTICTKHLQKIRLGIVSNVTPETQLPWRLCGEFRCLTFAPRRAYILRNLILSLIFFICIRSFKIILSLIKCFLYTNHLTPMDI